MTRGDYIRNADDREMAEVIAAIVTNVLKEFDGLGDIDEEEAFYAFANIYEGFMKEDYTPIGV